MRQAALSSVFVFSMLGLSIVNASDSFFAVGGGVNFATFNLDYPSGFSEPDQSFRSGLALEVGYQNPVGSHASLVTLGYESKGSVWSGSDGMGEKVEVTIRFNYVQAGVKYKFQSDINTDTKLYFAPGVALAMLVNSDAESGGESAEMEDVAPFDIELGVNLGTQVGMGAHAFFAEAGYAYGLLNTIENSNGKASANNSLIKIRMGFLFGI